MDEKKWKPNDEQRALLERLQVETDAAKSASAFARENLPFTSSKLSKILDVFDDSKPRSYFDDVNDPERVLFEIDQALDNINLKKRQINLAGLGEIHSLKKFNAVSVAVRECGRKDSPERLVKFLAPTGGGKSMLCNYLMSHHSARIVEVREAWRRSYFCVLDDIARAIGVRLRGETRPATMEDAIIRSLGQRSVILAMDEAEFFGTSAINGLKLLLNKTRVVIVLCAIPEAHDRWNRFFSMEAAQLARRTHAIIELDTVTEDDAAHFFPKNKFEDRAEALSLISDAATEFGMFSTVARIALRICAGTADKKDVEKAIDKARMEMIRTPLETPKKK